MANEKILVVDDEPVIRTLIEEVTRRLGYQAESAADTMKAMEAMSKTEYALAICDIKIPGNDGLWLLRQVKERYPDTQIVMITASDKLDDAIASLNLGAESYILKPLNIAELSHAVEKAIEKGRLLIAERERKNWMEMKLQEQNKRIQDLYIGSLKALAISLEAKDKYTKGHTERVSRLSTSLARAAGEDEGTIEKISISASLHDIGKIGTRESVLNKPGKLTEEEYEHIKEHPVLSEQIVAAVVNDTDITLSVRHHHERFDGKGYPDGLSKDEIPFGARVIALADAYDAMTSDRPYRQKPCSRQEAMRSIEENTGTQFAPELAKVFLHMFENEEANNE